MFKLFGQSVFYTMMNVRYAALIIPTCLVAWVLQLYPLAVMAGVLLVLATGLEVGLSVANGVGAAMQIREQDLMMTSYLDNIEKHANDWTHRGSEDPTSEGEGEDPPGEGQVPVPAR